MDPNGLVESIALALLLAPSTADVGKENMARIKTIHAILPLVVAK
jgi:hypothetical protein